MHISGEEVTGKSGIIKALRFPEYLGEYLTQSALFPPPVIAAVFNDGENVYSKFLFNSKSFEREEERRNGTAVNCVYVGAG